MSLAHFIDLFISFITLAGLEIVLGIDNLVFIAILTHQASEKNRKVARLLGLSLALIMRLLLLASIVWITKLTQPIFYLGHFGVSFRDLFLLGGGLFLLIKGTLEIHAEFEQAALSSLQPRRKGFLAIVLQIAIFDLIFSFDSILTAIGLTDVYWIMAAAILVAILVMLFASEPLGVFIQRHPTIKMLALSFLLLIGMVLIADGLHFHVPRAYVYFAICFSVFVESLNVVLAKKRKQFK